MTSLAAIRASNASVSLAGKNAIVVGGTSGIGKGIALRLAQANASVTIIGRNEEAGNEIVSQMKELSSHAANPPVFKFMKCDAMLLSNVKSCAEELAKAGNPIDTLVLTQGIASVNGHTPTSEGIEQKLAIHYYGRIAFAKCLIPQLEAAEKPQVVSVLSAGIHAPYAGYAEDPDLEKNFSIKNAADAAGFYNDIGLDMLSKEHSKVTFIHTAPGAVKTNWGLDFPWYLRLPLRGLQAFFRTTEDCAEYHMFAMQQLLSQPSDFYLFDANAVPTKKTTLHEEAAEKVWAHTKSILERFGIN